MSTEIIDASDARSVDAVAAALRSGGLAVFPTDTVYGIAAIPDDPTAVLRVFEAKQRPGSVNLPIMIRGRDDMQGLGLAISAAAERLVASRFVPGPLSLVLGFTAGERPAWLAGRDEAAVRAPDSPWILELLAVTGPLLVTSANAHGAPTPDRLEDVLAQLALPPAVAVRGMVTGVVPSTLVNCRLEPPVIERLGAVSEAEIREVLAGHEVRTRD